MGWRRGTTVGALLACGVLAGCGSGDEPSDDEVGVAAVFSPANSTPQVYCAQGLSDKFVRNTYLSRSRCRTIVAKNGTQPVRFRFPEGSEDKKVVFPDDRVDIDGARAEVKVQQSVDGVPVRGSVQMSKAAGRWQIDDIDDAFARSIIVGGLSSGIARGGRTNTQGAALLSAPGVKACIDRRLGDLDAKTARSLAYRAIGSRGEASILRAGAVPFARCLVSERGGRAVARQFFEEGIRKGVANRKDLPAGFATCMVRQLRRTLPSKVIAQDTARRIESGNVDRQPGAAMLRRAQQAGASCR